MAQIKSALHYEDYTVRLSYRKSDGFWVWGHEERVCVSSMNKGSGHAAAEQIARERFPGCVIINVSYF